MHFAGLQKNSTLDFPGNFACVIFFAGCNYDCYYCHNRHLLGKNAPTVDEAEVMAFLGKRKGLIDGVVLSGGEPTLQKEFIPFAEKLREMGYKIKIDSNGSKPDVLFKMAEKGLIDYAAIDYKAPFTMYEEICKHSAENVRESIALLTNFGIDYEMRTTMIPEIREEQLIQMASEMPVLPHYYLQLYRPPMPELVRNGFPLYTPGDIRSLAEKIRYLQPNTSARV
ncbi:MAG: anaerobic ribonucleoside-triphosphate reductase activating protein [Christensenellaceae bacterium]|nr:anaerobic ribonucleoside-triphosphate reductase activating protein [Christensenellaceae bacterium]